MRNFLALLGLSRGSSETETRDALEDLVAGDDYEKDMHAILEDSVRRSHYERVHLQYEAMASVHDELVGHGFIDSHHWDRRLVEFDDAQDPQQGL